MAQHIYDNLAKDARSLVRVASKLGGEHWSSDYVNRLLGMANVLLLVSSSHDLEYLYYNTYARELGFVIECVERIPDSDLRHTVEYYLGNMWQRMNPLEDEYTIVID